MTVRVALFVKPPVPGRVKTRLAHQCGKRRAAYWYRQAVLFMLQRLRDLPGIRVELHLSTPVAHPWLRQQAKRYGARCCAQCPGTLGQRMSRVLHTATAENPVLIIGGDCVGLTSQQIAAASESVQSGRQVVFVPAEDGGYVLVGGSGACPAIFRGICWGTGRVVRQTRVAARAAGIATEWLASAWDLDRPTDLRRFQRQLRCSSADG